MPRMIHYSLQIALQENAACNIQISSWKHQKKGSHVGFYLAGKPYYWSEYRALEFASAMA